MLNAILIGNETLTRECATMWLERGHSIAIVVTEDRDTESWARGRGLAVEHPGTDLAERLRVRLADASADANALTGRDLPVTGQVDWLLSIANLSILPKDILALAQQGAVNFHDGPLPQHAGLNAPVWALLQAETRHAINWHLVEGGLDEGAIVESRAFDISPDDTALTLNSRCFEAALESFPAVIAALETGARNRRPQNRDGVRRQLHRRLDRPEAMARLDFTRSAEEVVRLIRALDHGGYFNPLTAAKILVDGRVLLVGSAEVAGEITTNLSAEFMASPAPGTTTPGSVLAASPEGLVVACADAAVRLSGLSCLRGLPVCPGSIGARHLASPDASEAQRLTQALAEVVGNEAEARRALADFTPTTLPQLGLGSAAGDFAEWIRLPWDIDFPDAMPAGHASSSEDRVALLALALARALGTPALAFAYALAPGHSCRSDQASDDQPSTDLAEYIARWWPVVSASGKCLAEALEDTRTTLRAAGPGFARDLIARDPKLRGLAPPQLAIAGFDAALPGAVITLTPSALHVDISRLPRAEAEALQVRIRAILPRLLADPAADLQQIDPLSSADRALLTRVNATDQPHDRSITIASAFEAQVTRSPQAPALVFEDQQLSYAQLNTRANRVAHVLSDLGVGPGILVGLCTHRSTDMIIGALAILKAGGGYVPMDPSYPAERIALFVEDSACAVIVTSSDLEPLLPEGSATRLCLDTDGRIGLAPDTNLASGPGPEDIAYMIYTSGSTGRPKGVMVEHRNVANFFIGMDARIDHTEGSVWLAITSLSFDISVLELFWTLARGFKLVLSSDEQRRLVSSGRIASSRHMDFSLYYWGNDDGAGPKKYELLLEGARFADSHGFTAVWTPERHFHAFGGPYPNPSVTGAAIAAVTKNISVRAGACVLPLHHPARVAEEWAVIDNLTNGRAGLAVASGWHPEDFVLRPQNSPPAHRKVLFEATDQIRRLWRGEAVEFPMGDGGSLAITTQPRPVSAELPVWITTAGNPETWRDAGLIGAHVLTHLLGQSIEELAGKIRLYHAALREAGHDPEAFSVTLMLHSFLARDRELSRNTARGPMKAYLRAAAGLIKQYAWTFPAFKKPKGISNPAEIDIRTLSGDELEAILDFAFQRYFEDSGLFGTVEDGLARVEQLKRIGVTEVACLVDYGIAPEQVMEGFYPLAELVRRANSGGGVEEGDWSIAAEIIRHGVTHLQCTPSMARMIAMNDDSRMALSRVGTVMLGGEALPAALVGDLRRAGVGRILNMYGPTETTIWSSVEVLGEMVEGVANIGTPLANQQVHVLDEHMAPVPPGTAGELWIGGEGVTRGYWQRPDLTDERFRPDPFIAANPETTNSTASQTGRLYRSGDLVRMRLDGRLDFLGRADFQVKLRGFRVELGEIEAAIEAQPGITQAVVLAREDNPGDLRLVAYVSGQYSAPALRAALADRLPEHMLPAHFISIDSFPLTPNRKVDRKALPAPCAQGQVLSELLAATPSATFAAPTQGLEAQIGAIWCRVLGIPAVNSGDNFFALGGHSLLAVQMHREIRQELGLTKLSITDIFRFPTLKALAAHLDSGRAPRLQASPGLQAGPGPRSFVPDLATTALHPTQPAITAGQDEAQGGGQSEAMARRRAMRAGRAESGQAESV